MEPRRLIGFGILGAAALYLFSRPGGPLASLTLTPAPAPYVPPVQPTIDGRPTNLSPGAQNVYTGTQGPGPGNTPAGTPGGSGSAFPAQAVIGAGTSAAGAGIAAGAGVISGSAALVTAVTAGIGAGVALLAYGIIDKGWFRGGEEGIKVNPDRDQFLAQFANFDYYRDSANPPGFYGLNLILVSTVPQQQQGLQDALHNAHTVASFTAAAGAIVNVIKGITPAGWDAIKAAQNAYRTGSAVVPGTDHYMGA